jgi:hypothetical protein
MKKIIAFGVVIALLIGLWVGSKVRDAIKPSAMLARVIPVPDAGPSARTVVAVSLKAVQAQNRITPMQARYVAIVTTRESHMLGVFHSQKTLIMPGTVRYEIDMHKLTERDIRWDEKTKTLAVHLPPVEVSRPDVDMLAVQQYTDGMMTSFSTVDRDLDAVNRTVGQQRLLQQAREPSVMRMAQNAAARAIEQTFQMPMRAAGINATVNATF